MMSNKQFTPLLKASLLIAGFVLSAALGVALMGFDRGATVAESPGETAAQTTFRGSFDLRVLAPENFSLAEEEAVMQSFTSALGERFPVFEVSSKQTLEGYRIELEGNVVGSDGTEQLAPLYSDIRTFSTDYVTRHYRAKLVFEKPFNFSFAEAVAVGANPIPSLGKLITGGALGVALFSLLVLVIMIVVEGRRITKQGELENGGRVSTPKTGFAPDANAVERAR